MKLIRRAVGLAAFLIYALLATVAQASTVLVADTTLVSGSASDSFSFTVSGPGTISVQLTNLDWPQTLSSLSFMATTGDHVMSAWSGSGSMSERSFAVTAGGRYFANIIAQAGGPLDLGVYSFSVWFSPTASPVPLPSSGVLLLVAMAGLVALVYRRRGVHGPSAPAPAVSASS